jgi:hypothetical protein
MTGSDLNSLLEEFVRRTPGMEAMALVTMDGLIMASSLPSGAGEERVAAMSSALLSIASRIANELERGEFKRALVAGSEGFIVLVPSGSDFLLTAVCSKDARLGMVLFEINKLAGFLSRK